MTLNLRQKPKTTFKIDARNYNSKYLQLLNNDTPTQILFGAASSWAGKSYSMMHFTVMWALRGRTILVARKIGRTIRRSVFAEIVKAISFLKADEYFIINKSEFTIISKIGNGAIMFVGADDPNKLKSITAPKSGAIDICIFEEADSFTSDDFDIITSRMRGVSKFKKKAILIFNPVSKHNNWIYDRFFETNNWDDELDNEYISDDLLIMRCKYTDNKFLGQEEIDRLESMKDISPMFYRVYALGKFGVTNDRVFNNFRVEHFSNEDVYGLEMRVGLDFGFTHKNALVISYYDKKNRTIYVTAEIGVKQKTKVEFATIIRNKLNILELRNPIIYCDPAEPASIKELQHQGLVAKPAKKGKDSLLRSFDFLLSHTIILSPTCTQLFGELETLTYKKDTMTGEYYEEPVNYNDDLIAAFRYSYSTYYMNRGVVSGKHISF